MPIDGLSVATHMDGNTSNQDRSLRSRWFTVWPRVVYHLGSRNIATDREEPETWLFPVSGWTSGNPKFFSVWSSTSRSTWCRLPSAVCWKAQASSCSRSASSVYLFCKRLPNGTGILCMDFDGILSELSYPSIITAVPIAHSVVFGLCQLETRLPRGLAS